MKIWTTVTSFIRSKVEGRSNVAAILRNSTWLLGDRILRLAIGILINIWIARYLGPEQFGLWSYCISFAGLFVVLSNLGLDTIVVRELVRSPDKESTILGTAFLLKLVAGLATFFLTLYAIYIIRDGSSAAIWLVGLYSGMYIFQSLNVIDFYFQANVLSKYTVISSSSAFVIASIAKVYLLMTHASLIAIAAVGLGEMILTSAFLLFAYKTNGRLVLAWAFKYEEAKKLLGYSWPMILHGASIMISLRIDQIMIGNTLNDHKVGIFASAARMSELSFFIPSIIIASSTPAILHAKALGNDIYITRVQKLLDITVLLSFGVAILITISSGLIMRTLFGPAYAEAGPLLAVHAWSGLFSCLGAASGIWMISEGLQKNMFYRALFGMLTNIFLCYIWIPTYGVMGAALATVCSQIIASYISDIFSPVTQSIFKMKTRSLLMINFLSKLSRF